MFSFLIVIIAASVCIHQSTLQDPPQSSYRFLTSSSHLHTSSEGFFPIHCKWILHSRGYSGTVGISTTDSFIILAGLSLLRCDICRIISNPVLVKHWSFRRLKIHWKKWQLCLLIFYRSLCGHVLCPWNSEESSVSWNGVLLQLCWVSI